MRRGNQKAYESISLTVRGQVTQYIVKSGKRYKLRSARMHPEIKGAMLATYEFKENLNAPRQ